MAGLRMLRLGLPLQAALFDGTDTMVSTRRLVVDWAPDAAVVFTERLPLTLLGLADEVPVVLDAVDDMRAHMRERAEAATPLARVVWFREAKAFGATAKLVDARVCAIVGASPLVRATYPRAVVIPNAAPRAALPSRDRVFDVVFTGNLQYPPNVDAVEELCDQIVPALRATLPGLRIAVAGRSPTGRVKRLCERAQVELLANVPDISVILASSKVAVAPLRWSGGPNLKILEALAAGTPVVAYPAAVRLLPQGMEGVISSSDATSMARAVVDLLMEERDVSVRSAPSWDERASELEKVIGDAVTARAAQLS